VSEVATERHVKRDNLVLSIGYYALALETLTLTPEWRVLYEERKLYLEEELVSYNANENLPELPKRIAS